jgi:hypothetical protein
MYSELREMLDKVKNNFKLPRSEKALEGLLRTI